MPTLKIDKFAGRLTRQDEGDINSGFAKYSKSHSYDPFSNPGNLSWNEVPIQIDAAGSIITGCVVAQKERIESGIVYVYAIDHLARLYKIQVTKPSTNDPNFDTPVLLATLASNSPTFTMGGSMDFYGTTERIYIGHDIGVTRINFDGTNETFIGSAGSYTANVPRPLEQFLGNLYFGNGNNIGEIFLTTLNTYARLSPGFPSNTQVRDIDISPEGNYMELVVTELALGSIISTAPDPSEITHANSFIFKWNGTDQGYTSYFTFTGFSLTANYTYGQRAFTFGYDLAGAGIFNPTEKILGPVFARSPLPNGQSSTGNLMGWEAPEFNSGFLKHSTFLYGPLDQDYPGASWYRVLMTAAGGSDLNVIKIPSILLVSNLSFGSSTNSYTAGIFGNGKSYFSTIETDASNVAHYKFYKWFNVPTGVGTSALGVYETQNLLFSKKQKINQVRVYTAPLVANNSFTLSLIGSSGSAMTNGSKTFAAGTSPVAAGDDLMQWTPAVAPTYTLGLNITNVGTANMTIVKVEIDHEPAGL